MSRIYDGASVRADDDRVLVASSMHMLPEERLDLLIHALAQLPDPVRLEFYGSGHDQGRFRRLAAAYGVEERVRFSSDPLSSSRGTTVFPSLLNRSTAPVRLEREGKELLLSEGSGTSLADRRSSTMAAVIERLTRPDDPPASLRMNDGALRGQRVAVITNIPAHYRVPLFNLVAERLSAAESAFHVLFLAETYQRRTWMRPGDLRFEHTFLKSAGFSLTREWHPFIPRDLGAVLRRFEPTIIVSAGFSPLVSGRAALYARRRNIPFGLWSGEIARARSASRLRRTQRQVLTRAAEFAICYGYESGEYLRGLRSSLPLVYARNTTPVPPPARFATRRVVEILAVGDLSTPRKGIDVVVDAMHLLRELPCRLTVVGGGAMLGLLRDRASGLGERVRFTGAVKSDRVHELYSASDAFLFPTREDIFGLVLVEAMGAGLPTVVSRAPGALGDLCVSDHNCIVVDTHDPRAWASAIKRVVLDAGLRERLGCHASHTIASRWTMDHSADAFVAGLRLAL